MCVCVYRDNLRRETIADLLYFPSANKTTAEAGRKKTLLCRSQGFRRLSPTLSRHCASVIVFTLVVAKGFRRLSSTLSNSRLGCLSLVLKRDHSRRPRRRRGNPSGCLLRDQRQSVVI